MRNEVRLTVMIRKGRRGSRYKARLRGDRSPAEPGEIEVPLVISIDDTWFASRTNTLRVELADRPGASVEVKLP